MRNQSFSSLSVILFCCAFIRGVYNQCLDDQRTLLLQLKNSLIFSSTNSTKLVSWNQSSDCCTWLGVSCDMEGHVIGLDLSGELISGGFDNRSSLFNLQNLQILNLSDNNFASVIPSGFNKLKNLTSLNLSIANFEGRIPMEISQLTRLVSLDISTLSYLTGKELKLENPNLQKLVQNLTCIRQLYLDGVSISAQGQEWSNQLLVLPALNELSMSYCNLSGPIDSSFERLKNLSVIRLNGNNLSSSVPEFFANFTNLSILHLSGCRLSGVFPQNIFQVATLTSIDLSYNIDLHGTLPDFPVSGSLQSLVVSNTSFSGVLPNSINNLSQLSILDLSYCQFYGTFPNSISKLSQITNLDLSHNNFIGPIPSSVYFEALQNLVSINLEYNSIIGSIPSSLFELPLLQRIQLSHNQFSGLEEISNVSSSIINFLDLSNNNLEGPVPPFIFQLRVEYLAMSHNHLDGPIPLSLFQHKQLRGLDLSFNNLSGDLELNMISKLRKLIGLNLSYNNLTMIVRNSAFPSFPTIRSLSLASCNLRTVQQFLKNQSSLVYLDLSKNYISGTIPHWIWNLTFLSHLNLSQNYFRDWEEPHQSISSTLQLIDLHSNHLPRPLPFFYQELAYLDYSDNNLSSLIPSNIGYELPNLFFLSFSGNKIHGSVPKSICNVESIEVLDLSNNYLTGTIPKCLVANNGSLAILNLSRNKLTGNIDTFPGGCNLRTLQPNGNLLHGRLPKYLATCNMLEVLDIGNNQIDDKYPCWLESTPNLHVLILRSNKFHGNIECPVTKASWSQLQIIDLASNGFSGRIPSTFFKPWKLMMANDNDEKLAKLNHLQFEVLRYSDISYQDKVTVTSKGLESELVKILTIYTSVDLSCNKFKGPIPNEIGKLTALYILNLSHNALWGNIPSSLGNLKHLESLDLSANSLSGEIPTQLASLSFLSFLNLSFNQLAGRIPTGTQLQSFEAASYKGNKGLGGLPLTQNCSDTVPTPSGIFLSDTSSVNWKFISIELGFTFGIGMIILPILLWKRWRLMYSEFADKMLYHLFPQVDYVQERHGEQCYRTLRWKPY